MNKDKINFIKSTVLIIICFILMMYVSGCNNTTGIIKQEVFWKTHHYLKHKIKPPINNIRKGEIQQQLNKRQKNTNG